MSDLHGATASDATPIGIAAAIAAEDLPDGVPFEGHPDRWKILAVLCAALCVVVLDNTILSVAIPRIGGALSATESQLQWIVATYGLVLAALILPFAGLGDRFGRKGMLLGGMAVFGAVSGVAAFAISADQLILARCILGLGGAAIMPATLSVLSNVFPTHERARAIAVWSGASAIASSIGPLLGGFLLEHFWWGSVFLVNVPVTAAVFLSAWILVPNSKDPTTPPIDIVGSATWFGALGLLLFAVIEGTERGWTDPVTLGTALGGAVLLVAFAAWERHTPFPLLSPKAVSDRRMQAGMVAVPVMFFSVFGLQFVFTQWLQGVRDLSPLAAGLAFLPHAIAVLVGSLQSTRIVRRVGLGMASIVGMGAMAGSLLIGAAGQGNLAAILVAIIGLGLGIGLGVPPAVELIMGSVPPEQAGQAAGVNETIVEAGGALGIAVLGSVLAIAAGGAHGIAPRELQGPNAAAARQTFTDALAAPILVAVAILVLAAVVVYRRTRGTSAAGPEPVPGPAIDIT